MGFEDLVKNPGLVCKVCIEASQKSADVDGEEALIAKAKRS